MGDNDPVKGGRVSFRKSLLYLVAVVAAGATLYYESRLGNEPVVLAYPSPMVYLSKPNQIGIPVAFTNSGTAAAAVVAGSLELARDGQRVGQAFALCCVSPVGQESSHDNDKRIRAARVDSPFTDVSLKAGRTGEQVFWFVPPPGGISFQPGQHTACVRLVSEWNARAPSGAEARHAKLPADCSFSLTFNLDRGALDILSSGSQDSVSLSARE